MSNIAPFPGLRYNLDRTSEAGKLIAPPYDKIPQELRKELWSRDEYNVIHIILPPPGDENIDVMTQSTGDDWYADAANRLKEWIDQGVLKHDEPQFYVYRQTYTFGGVTRTRAGLFVALELEDQGGPHAHENTFEGPKADRLRLLHATKTNTSPIFLLSDGEWDDWSKVFGQASETLMDFEDHEGQSHQLLALKESEASGKAIDYIKERTLVIADGHHRYETAQNYRREMMKQTGKSSSVGEPWGYCLALVVPISNPGLIVLPTHRVITELPENWLDTLQSKTAEHCKVETLDVQNGQAVQQALENAEGAAIVCYSEDKALLISSTKTKEIPALQSLSEATRGLNVNFLHHYLLAGCLGLKPEDLQGKTKYVRGEGQALDLVNRGECQGAFLLEGIPPETVFDVSLQGVRMPQKSTDFYPKIPTGLVMRPAIQL